MKFPFILGYAFLPKFGCDDMIICYTANGKWLKAKGEGNIFIIRLTANG
jgi:hypothetical protein